MKESFAKTMLMKEKCCSKKMKIYDCTMLNSEEWAYSATCKECGAYIRIGTGQLDGEEVEELNKK